MIEFFEGGGIVPYKRIHGEGELAYYKRLVEDKVYIYIEIPDAYYGFKELVACITDKTIVSFIGFSKKEAESLINEYAEEEKIMRWHIVNSNRKMFQNTGNYQEMLGERFIETFIPSRDTAAYLSSIGHIFTNKEKAIIIANHELLSNENKLEMLMYLEEMETDVMFKRALSKEIRILQHKLHDYYMPDSELFEFVFIPHDFRTGDVVRVLAPHGFNKIGVIIGYEDKEYQFYQNLEGDYSDVQVCVDTRFRNYDYLGEFSHHHVNPIYIERAHLAHDDERLHYLEYLVAAYNKDFLSVGQRNPYRMTAILRMVNKIWTRYPDLRLGQLMLAVMKEKDLFSVEDHDLMDALYQMLDIEERNSLWEDEEIDEEDEE